MNQQELISTMVAEGATLAEAKEIYRGTLGSLAEQLARAVVADIPGVGTFSAHVTHKPAVKGVNPFTRQPITFAARDIVRIRYSPDSSLLAAIDARSSGLPLPEPSGPLHGAFVAALIRMGVIRLSVGNFRVIKMPARRARLHPRTGAVLVPARPAHRDVVFRASSRLKSMVIPALRRAPDDER